MELEIHRYTGNWKIRKIWGKFGKFFIFPGVFKIPGSGLDLNFGDCRTKFYIGVR